MVGVEKETTEKAKKKKKKEFDEKSISYGLIVVDVDVCHICIEIHKIFIS